MDVVLAAVLGTVGIVSVLAGKPDEGPLQLTLPVAVVMTAALAWRTRFPLLAVTVVMVAAQVQTALSISPGALWSFAAFLICAYSVAAACPEGRAAIGGAVVVGFLWLQEWSDHASDYLFVAIVFGGAWLLGRAMRTWRGRAETAEAHQDHKARLAVAEERLRIAQELHDIVAHGLGVIAVQANAAEAALDHDPALARAPVAAIKDSARTALDDMRQLLGVLRGTDGDHAPHEPQPGVGRLDGLVAGFQRAGLPVRLTVHGVPAALVPVVDLAAYRIVQEGLTNALKHAGPVPTSVTVIVVGEHLCVEVVNERGMAGHAGPGTGNGLAGVRERAAGTGGWLTAGHTPTGGFRLHAMLPIAGAAS